MSACDDLVQFLRDRLDEDERVAQQAGGKAWAWEQHHGDMCTDPTCPYGELATDEAVLMTVHGYDTTDDWQGAAHIARHDPARALAEVEAKREALRQYEWLIDVSSDDTTGRTAVEAILRTMVAMYADHPDYREEWRP